MSLLRNVYNISKDVLSYGADHLLNKSLPYLGDFVLTGANKLRNMGVSESTIEKLTQRGLENISDLYTPQKKSMSTFLKEKGLEAAGEVVNEYLNNFQEGQRNNGGNSAYPQDARLNAPKNDSLNALNGFSNVRNNDRTELLKKESERIKQLKSEGKPIFSEETIRKRDAMRSPIGSFITLPSGGNKKPQGPPLIGGDKGKLDMDIKKAVTGIKGGNKSPQEKLIMDEDKKIIDTDLNIKKKRVKRSNQRLAASRKNKKAKTIKKKKYVNKVEI
jgi:hypothetical protein